MQFCFGDIVIIEDNLIGVIVKSFAKSTTHFMNNFIQNEPHYDVYVREYNCIKDYPEYKIQRYMVRHKYLDEQELEWQSNAINGI